MNALAPSYLPRLPNNKDWIVRVAQKSADNMKQFESCSQSILSAFMDELNVDDPLLLRSAGTLHGGLLSSLTCGVHIGGMMVLGLFLGREDITTGVDGLMPAAIPGQKLIRRLNNRLGSHSCLELTGYDFTDINQVMEYYASPEKRNCITRVKEGAEEIAGFLCQMNEDGELFRAG